MIQYSKKAVFTLVFSAILLIGGNLMGQTKEKSQLKKKLSEIKGKVEKITVKVDGKDVVFEGKEAEALAKQFKARNSVESIISGMASPRIAVGSKSFTWSDDEEDSTAKAFSIFMDDKDSKDGESKEMKLEVKNGEKKLTVTTSKDGKESTKIYEGDDVEKYLEENDIDYLTVKPGRSGSFSIYPGLRNFNMHIPHIFRKGRNLNFDWNDDGGIIMFKKYDGNKSSTKKKRIKIVEEDEE